MRTQAASDFKSNIRIRGYLGSNPTAGNILLLDFFSRSKATVANIAIIVNVVNLRKTWVTASL